METKWTKTVIYLLSGLVLWLALVYWLSVSHKNQIIKSQNEVISPLVKLEQLRKNRIELENKKVSELEVLSWINNQLSWVMNEIQLIKKSLKNELNLY